MDIRNYIESNADIKEKYEYYLSLGYGQKAASVLSVCTYGSWREKDFYNSFKGEGILDRIYDYFAESNALNPVLAINEFLTSRKADEDLCDASAQNSGMTGAYSAIARQSNRMTGQSSNPQMFMSAAMSQPMMGMAAMTGAAAAAPSGAMGLMSGGMMATQMSMAKMPEMNPNLIATDSYESIEEKDAKSVLTAPTSTFRMTTSTASVGVLLNQVRSGRGITMSQVRIEELLNYFDYDNGEWSQKDRKQFRISTELMDKAEGRKILYINVQADDTPKEKQNVVLLLDTSGSMSSNSDTTQEAIATVIAKLKEGDVLSMVTYSSEDHTIFTNHVIKDQKDKENLMGVLLTIEITGCTNGSAGIETAYSLGEKTYKEGWSNQVILITDGDLNFGVTAKDGLQKLIEEKKKTGMFLSVIGTGLYNYKDDKLEVLSKHGNGTYTVINDLFDVKESIDKKYVSLTNIVAKDVKAQIEFNPKYVKKYRLLGYENRTLNHEDFKNDEVISEPYGAGGQGVALYELYMGDATETPSEELKYQKLVSNDYKELGTVSIRFKAPMSDVSEEISDIIPENISSGNNVKAAYLLYCLSEKLRGSNKLDVDDYKFLASMLNDDKYKELLEGKDDIFKQLFDKVKQEALKQSETKETPANPFGNMFFDNSCKPGAPIQGLMGMNLMNQKAQAEPSKSTEGWKCPICGCDGNRGKFCADCGHPQPDKNSLQPGEWLCSCGTVNTANFCFNCGAVKPKN